MNTVLLPVLLCFFLRPAVLRLLAELLRAVVLLLPEERLPAVLRLWVLRFWPCFVLWRAGSCAAVFSSGARLDTIGSFAPQRAR